VGHSAGGSAISAAAVEGSLCEVDPVAVIWSDASYGRWLQNAWGGCLNDSCIKTHILVRKWDKPYREAADFMKSFTVVPARVKHRVLDRKKWSHGAIGNRALMLTDVFPLGC
jgi:hypothetical protein